MVDDSKSELMEQAARGRTTAAAELVRFLVETKKWWLAPVILCLLLFGALVFLSGTAAAPFIYTLF